MTTCSNPPVDWLLAAGDAWVQYRTRIDLLGQPETDPAVKTARAAILDDPRVQTLIATLGDWPGPPLPSHKKSAHHLHLLAFLAETGVRVTDPGMESIVDRVLDLQDDDGPFLIQIGIQRGNWDITGPAWMLCDAPLVAASLCKLGVGDDPRVTRAVDHLTGLVYDNGWRCVAGFSEKFRGPGRKDDPCPYATLLALRALAARGPAVDGGAVKAGIEMLLWHWEHQAERKLYMFGVGTDFRKPKLPLVWYDILHVLDVLSHFPEAHRDPRYAEMLAALMDQADDAGRFTPASMYRDWQDWEFANKKQPSPGITLVAWRAAQRGIDA